MKDFIYSFLLVREKPTNKNAPNKAQSNIQNIMYILKLEEKAPKGFYYLFSKSAINSKILSARFILFVWESSSKSIFLDFNFLPLLY